MGLLDLPQLTLGQWLLGVVAALCVGLSKSGFAGLGLVTVVIFARLFPAMESTGVLLPLLVFGDICSVLVFRRHANWVHIRKVLLPTALGIAIGFFIMKAVRDLHFGPFIGWVVLALSIMQVARMWRPGWFERVPHSQWFALTMGFASGVTTMLANAAGPVMALYFLALSVPKFELVGTSAWLFLIINVSKIPLSVNLDLIHGSSLGFDLLLAPAVAVGIWLGKKLVPHVPQRQFELIVLALAAVTAVRLIGWG